MGIDSTQVPQEYLSPLAGKLWLMAAPGEGTNVEEDLAQVKAKGASAVFCLQEEFELGQRFCRPPQNFAQRTDSIHRLGMRAAFFPVPDGFPPSDKTALFCVQAMRGFLEEGQGVALHCLAGKGRTGTLAACLLVSLGIAPQRAVDVIRKIRPGSLAGNMQETFVYQFNATQKR